MRDIISICGGFKEDTGALSLFSGWLEDISFLDFGIKTFQGKLIDEYGPSRIIGRRNEEKLSLRKHYANSDYPIFYNFSFDKDRRLWLGGYVINGLVTQRGKAVCKLFSLGFDLKETIDALG